MGIKFSFKDKYSIADLKQIMELLRSPDGCPWDIEQTHSSIRSNVIEEAYEAADAIDSQSSTDLCEELGDLLLQVIFHSQIAHEADEFDFDDVTDGICKKLILRHPHVFGDTRVNDSVEVLNNWDAIKKVEKQQVTYTDTLKSVPKAFPALMRAQKVLKRAEKAGIEFDSRDSVASRVSQTVEKVKSLGDSKDEQQSRQALGDLLTDTANLCRLYGFDAEELLAESTDRFINKFSAVEQEFIKSGLNMKQQPREVLKRKWQDN
ncbi:MAG: nucleoside triphosphate pyrophosphohydrolase [bacterium]|nr:nucleoside triphosphate pyrophosphohydrolase [bacterium]